MTSEQIREAILSVVPSSRFVLASDVVDDLSRRCNVPAKQIWPEIVMLTFDGELVGDRQQTAEGKAMIRRRSAQHAEGA